MTTYTTYVNYSENETVAAMVDSIINGLETHRPLTTETVVNKAMDLTVNIVSGNETVYRVVGETGSYYSVNVATMSCDCNAGTHNQNCSHALAAAMRHTHLMTGTHLRVSTERVNDSFLVIFE